MIKILRGVVKRKILCFRIRCVRFWLSGHRHLRYPMSRTFDLPDLGAVDFGMRELHLGCQTLPSLGGVDIVIPVP